MCAVAVIEKCVTSGSILCDVRPHPNVSFEQLHGKHTIEGRHDGISAATNWGSHEELVSYLASHKDEQTVKTILLQLAHAVHHIHENGFSHGKIDFKSVYLTKPTLETARSKSSPKVLFHYSAKICDGAASEAGKLKDITDMKEVFRTVLIKNEEGKIKGHDAEIANNLLDMMEHSTSTQVLQHPFFWDAYKKLTFLSKIAQFSKSNDGKQIKDALDEKSSEVFDVNWTEKLEIPDYEERDGYTQNLRSRKGGKDKVPLKLIRNYAINPKGAKKPLYSYDKLQSLLNFIRNRWDHFWESNLATQACFNFDHTDGYWQFYGRRFPNLFTVVYNVVKEEQTEWNDSGIEDIYFKTMAENKELPKHDRNDPTDCVQTMETD